MSTINSREEDHVKMMPQRDTSESINEQASSTYGSYQGDQEYARQQRDEISYEQLMREGLVGKVYQPQRDNTNLFRLLVFAIAMVTLLVFVVVCLVFIGGTGGWISFCAASFAILVIASVIVSPKPEGTK